MAVSERGNFDVTIHATNNVRSYSLNFRRLDKDVGRTWDIYVGSTSISGAYDMLEWERYIFLTQLGAYDFIFYAKESGAFCHFELVQPSDEEIAKDKLCTETMVMHYVTIEANYFFQAQGLELVTDGFAPCRNGDVFFLKDKRSGEYHAYSASVRNYLESAVMETIKSLYSAIISDHCNVIVDVKRSQPYLIILYYEFEASFEISGTGRLEDLRVISMRYSRNGTLIFDRDKHGSIGSIRTLQDVLAYLRRYLIESVSGMPADSGGYI